MAFHGTASERHWGYAQGVEANGLIHLSGQVPRNDQEVPTVGSLPVTFGRAFDLVESALGKLGATLQDLVDVQLFMFEDNYQEGIELYRARVGDARPALSLVLVEGLNHPDYALEVSAIAARPGEGADAGMRKILVDTGNPVDERLGRSAAVRVGDFVYVSAQPSVGSDGCAIEDDSFAAHYGQAFANFVSAVEAAGGKGGDVVSTHTYVTEPVPADEVETVRELHRQAIGQWPDRSTSTLVRVASLPVEGTKVQIAGVAVIGAGS